MYSGFSDRPGPSAVSRAEHPRYFSAACAEPDIGRSLHRNTGITGGERAFSRQARYARLPPRRAAIVRQEDQEAPVHRIAQHDAMLAIPERNRIKKHTGGLLFKCRRPILAAIGGSVN